jgi:ubiquinone/menaquinone biosynthesis C-methylase UbiE
MGYYHKKLQEVFLFVVSPGQCVIEVGCGRGYLLASLKPLYQVGIDFSEEMIKLAKDRHRDLYFMEPTSRIPSPVGGVIHLHQSFYILQIF